ncbi:MAG: hypothetical protein OEL20_04490 [Sulfuritalea sp.]|nr:hypothetical protein [Sulfuritalea sp.]
MNTSTHTADASPQHAQSLIGVMDILKEQPRRAAVLRIGDTRMNVKLLRSGFLSFDGAVPSAGRERELEIDIARAGSIVEPLSTGGQQCTPS